MDLEIIISPLIEKIKQSVLSQSEKDEGVKLLKVALENAKQKPRMSELEKLLSRIYKVEDIIDIYTARNNSVPFKPFILVNSLVIFPKQLHKQYKCLSDLNKLLSSSGGTEVQSKTSSKVDNHGVREKKSSSNIIHLKSLSKSKDVVDPSKKSITTTRASPTISEDIQVFTSGNKDVDRDGSVLKDVDEGQHQSWAKTSCQREEGSVPVVLEHLVSKLAQPFLNVRTRQLLILKTNLTSPAIAIFLWSAYNSYHTKQHFQSCSWVRVSRESGEGNILNDILKQVTGVEQQQWLSNQLMRKRLHDFLVFKRYLIVLYGVLRDDIWDNLKSAVPYSLNGSRVILLLSGGTTLNNVSKNWSHQQLRKFSDYLQEESGTLGVEDILNELSQSILNPYRMLFLISIVGAAESEKTTFLWAMYNAEDVKQLFQCRAWVPVSEKFKEKNLLAEILKQVTDNKQEEELDLEPLRLTLCNFLAQKRYLIVLYDVWSANVWDKLKLSLPNLMNGSRVILTVRKADVAQQTNSWTFGTVCGKELLREKVCNPKFKHSWGRLSDIMAKDLGFIGLDDKVKELAEVVLNSYQLHFLISVVGVAGSGKTALVKAIYNSLAIKRHFDCRAFVSVSEVFEMRQLLADISVQLGMMQKDSWSKEELQQRLQIYLAWKRYLIVLDDVHMTDVWRELSRAFPDPLNGSKMILTIRDAHLALRINPHIRVLQLRLLNDNESWELFVKKVPKVKDNVELITLKNKILQLCGGLPLDIVVLGGLLSTKQLDISVWSSVVIGLLNKRERKKRVNKKSSDQPASSYTEQENEKKKMASQDDNKNPMADQPNSLAQHASSDIKLEETDGLGEIEQVGPSEAQPNFSVQQSFLDKKQEEEVKHESTKEDQESSSNQLASSDTKEKEDGALVAENTYFDQAQSDSSDETLPVILASGYRDLQPDLMFCLNYLGLFPKAHRVPFRRLFQLLLAEGLQEQSTEGSAENGQKFENSGSFEEKVKEHVRELEQRSMIEVEKSKLDGSPKTIFMINAVYDALSPRAMKVRFFHIHPKSKCPEGTSNRSNFIRRFAEHTEINDVCLQDHSSCLRSYISFNMKKDVLSALGVDKLLKEIVKRGFGLIVILDFEKVFKPPLSNHLSKLPNLKYLGLRWTFLDSIPESVGDLPCLQTLDVKHTNLRTLPGTFWKAKNLQHLYLNNICFDPCISKAHRTNGSLSNLQTLLGLVIRNKNSVAYLKAAKTDGLRKLGLKCYEESIDEIVGWISQLKKLQSLKLRSIEKSGQPASLKLGGFRLPDNLSQLYLFGKHPEAFHFGTFTPNLEILTLSVSELLKDPMEELGTLAKLKTLRLHAHSYTGETMTCRPSSFTQLRVLKLWMLEELKEWILEEKAMPALEEVEIRCCMKLNKPSGLEKLTTLKELVLTNMKEDFVKEVKESMSSNVSITVNNWKDSSWQ